MLTIFYLEIINENGTDVIKYGTYLLPILFLKRVTDNIYTNI